MGHFYTGEAFDLSFQTDYVTGKITPCRFLKEDFEFRAFVIRNLDGSLTFFGIEGKISVKDAGWNDETSCEGTISVGCGEIASVKLLTEMMAEFSRKYPRVKFDVYTANADQIKHRMDNGLTDIGLLLEPADMERYEYIVYERLSPSINRLFSVLWYGKRNFGTSGC